MTRTIADQSKIQSVGGVRLDGYEWSYDLIRGPWRGTMTASVQALYITIKQHGTSKNKPQPSWQTLLDELWKDFQALLEAKRIGATSIPRPQGRKNP